MYATIEEAYAARRAEEAQRITERVTISLLIDYVQGRYGEQAAAAARGFLTDWKGSRLPTHVEMDELVQLHRDGQDHAWWAERQQSDSPNGKANGNLPTP